MSCSNRRRGAARWSVALCLGVLAAAPGVWAGDGGPRDAGGTAHEPLPVLGVRMAVARVDGTAVASRAWVDTQVRHAQRIFAQAGVRFRLKQAGPVAGVPSEVHTLQDRHALRDQVMPGMINVFVVARLRDVHDPERFRQGVHWRPPPRPGIHYVILSAEAQPDVLAHELGHFFGNHRHSTVPGNVMSYERGDGPPFFDATQIKRIRRHVRHFLDRGELVDVE